MLPVVLELGVELTLNAESSSALLWLSYGLHNLSPRSYLTHYGIQGLFVYMHRCTRQVNRPRTFRSVQYLPYAAESALRAGHDARPPLNMHRALIFEGAFALAVSATVLGLRGKQTRRELDEQRMQEMKAEVSMTEQVVP